MNRSGPIQRKTPMRQRSSLPARRRKPRRTTRRQDHGQPWPNVRQVLYLRCGGRCEGCGTAISFERMEGHHRLTRRLGPDCPCNAVALCHECHHGPEGHNGPERARELGRIISRHSDCEPSTVPVVLWQKGAVLLDCEGGYRQTA